MTSLSQQWENLKRYYAATGFRISLPAFMAVMLAFAAIAAMASLALIQLLPPDLKQNAPIVAAACFAAIISLIIGIPVTIRNNRISAIENNLPDALKHMALVLKAGGTTEAALEEVANADYGPLSADLKIGLKGLKEGKPFDDVLRETAINTGSVLFNRTSAIMVDARRAGAGLADVMNAVGDDARDILRIGRERKSRTMMHVMFLIISGLFLSPFIFGFTMSIVSFMSSGIAVSGTGLGESGSTVNMTIADCRVPCLIQTDPVMAGFLAAGLAPLNTVKPLYEWRLNAMDQLLMVFLAIVSIVTLVAIGVIREGKLFKYVLYFPFAILAVIVIYLAGKIFSGFIIGS
ncbi:MAG: type II secretion system F family protein [Candidatus Micrarchaeia archaeon]|jgi:archaellum biogenesis protein FlaJ (TadC family)